MLSRSPIRVLFLTIVAEVISFAIVIPIVPLLFTEPSSAYYMLPDAWPAESGFLVLGLVIGLYPLAQFLSTPILGDLSDIYGRKRVIQLSIAGTVISTALFGIGILTGSIALLLVSRLFNGLTGGLIAVARSVIADTTAERNRSANFGKLGAAFGVGFMIGPFMGGLLSSDLHPFLTAATPFWVAAGLSALSLGYVRSALPETSPMQDKTINWRKPFSQLLKGLRIPGLTTVFSTAFLYYAGFAFFTTFIPVFIVKQFGFSQIQSGNFFLYLGMLVIIGQGVLVPKVYERVTAEKVLPAALFLTGLFIALQPVAALLPVFLATVTLFSLANAHSMVGLQTVVSLNASDRDQGLALGTNQSVQSLGTAIPSMLSGVAAAAFGAAVPLYLAGTIIMVAAVLYWFVR